MFEVDGEYTNRKGSYTVLSFDGDMMTVRYNDGTEAKLRTQIQFRIWENIQAELASTAAAGAKKKLRAQSPPSKVGHFIKVISIPPGDELIFPGWEERVVLVTDPKQAKAMQNGDRLIYYALEAQLFIAVGTLTGEGFRASPAKYTFSTTKKRADFFHVDIDAAAARLEFAVPLDSIELESLPNFGDSPAPIAEAFLAINEDDFEVLSEALTEISEEEIDLDDLDDDDLDIEDEDD